MTITQIDHSTRAETSAKSDSLELRNDADTSPAGQVFGKVMSQVMQPRMGAQDKEADAPLPAESEPQREAGQELAESGMGMPMLFNLHTPINDSWSLKAVSLGPTLNVITADKAAPDEQSLEAFARSQGLDENAVQWLLGHAPGSAQPGNGTETGTTAASVLFSISASSTASAAAAPVPSQASAVTALAGPSLSDGMANMGTEVAVAPTPSAPTLASTLTAGAVLWSLSQATDDPTKPTAPVAQTDAPETAEIQRQMLRDPTPAALWILRNNAQTEAPAVRQSASQTPSLSEIDLTAEVSPEMLESLITGLTEPAPGPAPMTTASHPSAMNAQRQELTAAGQTNNSANNAPEAPESSAMQRSENLHNLAEKMGQAVGQRILSEIEKGQWHLKLQLRPATLGHIEVDMKMLSGQLDAVFNAPQALTRELLQDGLSRLKDTLSQMGMDVASMQVGDGQTRQRGGDSTPNQASKSADLVKNDSESTNSQAIGIPRQKMGEDGWDVLV